MLFKNHSRFSVTVVLCCGLLTTLSLGILSGCATSRNSRGVVSSKVSRLESKLRKANARIETLRERNWVLKNRIKIIEANEGIDPATAPSKLAAFPEGVELDVAINPTRLNAAALPAKKTSQLKRPRLERPSVLAAPVQSIAGAPKLIGESADRVLARTVVELLKSGDEAEADRTALLLEKSYPDSQLVAEARFQQGLYYFRKNNLSQADRFFRAALVAPQAHIRARAGAALLRGVMAKKTAKYETARKSFSYVTGNFPGSPEAARARREVRVLKRLEASAIVRKK